MADWICIEIIRSCINDFDLLTTALILAQQFEKAMQKIIRIAPLIIALILGTCYGSQAQIVTALPVNIDGGFNMYKNHNPGFLFNGANDQPEKNKSEITDKIETSQIPVLIGFNKYIFSDYELYYPICQFRNDGQTDLKKGSYYAQYLVYRKDSELNMKYKN